MTIKPVTQKSGEKKETHGHQESQSQNLVGTNVRNNHRNVLTNKSNVEGQSPQRRSDVFEENISSRHRRSPHKSGSRSKREHKRDQREREKVCTSPQYTTILSKNCNSPQHQHQHQSSSTKSPKHVTIATGPSSAQQSANNNNVISAAEDTTYSGYNSGDEHLMPKENLLSPDEWKDRDDAFITAMSERGFIIKDIVEDGACLFRAISLQIYGDEEMHEVIRQQTMDYIYKNREYFAHFVTEDINTYVTRKRNKNSHGNHIEIQAMSELYNRPVELYCYKTTPINIFNSEQINNGYDPLRLSYQRGSHYNAILDPYNASVGVGLGLAGYKPESQTREAIRLSEQLEIEQTMFEDKLKTTDWEATNEAIEEQIARESYLQWCRDNMQNAQKASSNNISCTTSSTVTSAEAQTSFNNNNNSNNNNINNNIIINNNNNSTGCSSSYTIETNSKESINQYHKKNSNNNNNDNEQLSDKTNIIPATQNNNNIINNNNNNINNNNNNISNNNNNSGKINTESETDYCRDTDDTDLSSSSSIDSYDDNNKKKGRHHKSTNKAKIQKQQHQQQQQQQQQRQQQHQQPQQKRLKRRRNQDHNDDDDDDDDKMRKSYSDQSTANNNDDDYLTKRSKFIERYNTIISSELSKNPGRREAIISVSTSGTTITTTTMLAMKPVASPVEATITTTTTTTPTATTRNFLPGTSKEMEIYQPVSKFYQSLLESSYTPDGLGQLTENQMVLKAIEMSRIDFIEEQRRKYGAIVAKDAADEDSDSPQ